MIGRLHLLAAMVGVSGLLSATDGATRVSRAEAPASRESVADTTLQDYTVDGVRVVQRLMPATGVVAVNVYLLGGVRQLTPSTQGIEALLLRASRHGTRRYPDSTLARAWGRTGSSVEFAPDVDWSVLGFRGISTEFDASWDIIADRLMAPTLSATAVSQARANLQSMLQQMRTSPNGAMVMASDSVLYAGHPYGLAAYGTPATLATIDSAALATYQREQMVRSRMLVVVAGDVPRARVEAAVKRSLAALPMGSYVWTAPTPPPQSTRSVTYLSRYAPTNYVMAVFQGPRRSDGDFAAFRVAADFLSYEITKAVREQNGLSYAAFAGVHDDRTLSSGFIYVSTGRPNDVLKIIRQRLNVLRNPDSLPPGIFLSTGDNNSLTMISRRATSEAQVSALGEATLLQNNPSLASTLSGRDRGMSTSTIRNAITRYFRRMQFVYVGDTTRVTRESFEGF
jgi:zinc protease